MANKEQQAGSVAEGEPVTLEGGTYEVIRNRLLAHGDALRTRMAQLNEARMEVFGSIETTLKSTERITTENNCIPRDIIDTPKGFLFGYNVNLGLKTETQLKDVFQTYIHRDGGFFETPLKLLDDQRFHQDFANLYKYYRETRFVKFAQRGPNVFMVFRFGKEIVDIKTFKWAISDEGWTYIDHRSDHEYTFPPQHDFTWKRAHRDMHRSGDHPHISLDDICFVEAVGGDITFKIEDNTSDGEGIYSEAVDHADQTLDDAETFYARLGNLVLVKIRPYQEEDFRYFVYNDKVKQVSRIDSIGHACILLPEDHGLIFSNGYYLQDGEEKRFDIKSDSLLFERRIDAPNGEDYLYAFYNRDNGNYVLLTYNLISKEVAPPILCHGFTVYENGETFLFKGESEPQKHHSIQRWQTPFTGLNFIPEVQSDSYLYKLGNKPIVRCIAECQSVVNLINKEDTYADLYVDIVKESGTIIDNYFWVNTDDACHLDEPLQEIKQAAAAAVEQFEKVTRLKSSTAKEVRRVTERAREIVRGVERDVMREINQFVSALSDLRSVRGEIISLKDLRYVDHPSVEALETEVAENTERLSGQCVEFLLRPEALDPYRHAIGEVRSRVGSLDKGAEAKVVAEEIGERGAELEMLIEIVSNLKIDDPTRTTAIIDAISDIYAELNQIKAQLNNRRQELARVEGVAEFNAQLKLLNQSVLNYLEVCDTPEKCDEYSNKMLVQIETLESRFADFDEYIEQLGEKREELYTAFENRKVTIMEARSGRANTLHNSAERILKGIANRANGLKSVVEINGYFAADLMIEKVRDTIAELQELNESVKADEIQTRLKTIQEDAVRQLKDRQDLYEDGDNLIKIGRHRFTVNNQALELTTVNRDGDMVFHLNGTGFFEKIEDDLLNAHRDVWVQTVVSETPDVYRAEYLAWQLAQTWSASDGTVSSEIQKWDDEQWGDEIQAYAGPRYAEGYTKGVHDHDAGIILRAYLDMSASLGLLRYRGRVRALALYYWHTLNDDGVRARFDASMQSFGRMRSLFEHALPNEQLLSELSEYIAAFCKPVSFFDAADADAAAEYLWHELSDDARHVLSDEGANLFRHFTEMLKRKKMTSALAALLEPVASAPMTQYAIVRDWVMTFASSEGEAEDLDRVDEVVALYLMDDLNQRSVLNAVSAMELDGLKGVHEIIRDGGYALDYHGFREKLSDFTAVRVPAFEVFSKRKHELVEQATEELRLDEFKPRILSSFVRNRLLDEIYLPLIGDNLAKQLGTAGDNTRTDRMGLLLLISPPGYGKTTLMEYVANRLGVTFVKVNGPAIGHDITSLDPSEAKHASAREELNKLNLAFEMGDNIMIYLDDIQHTHPELLQKFISLCDGQRKIEGVYKGRARTYDLRGKKVSVVMAGNPYTESGDKFQIPDMLSNRADTYNLGDIIGGNDEAFKLSYLENALTSSPVLADLARQDRKDIYALVRMAENGEEDGVEFEGNYGADELREYVDTLKKLLVVRDVILKVNGEYIRSAGMEDAYRTEPSFKLQGSYRNMNRITEKVLPVMNDEELITLVLSAYEQDAQTLTTGAESNMLKFKELMGWQDDEEVTRWADIKRTFKKRQGLMGMEEGDKVGMVIQQLGNFSEGLDAIRDVLEVGASASTVAAPEAAVSLAPDLIERIESILGTLVAPKEDEAMKSEVAHRLPDAISKVMEQEVLAMKGWLEPVLRTSEANSTYMVELIKNFNSMVDGYNDVLGQLKEVYFPEIKPNQQIETGARANKQSGASEPGLQ